MTWTERLSELYELFAGLGVAVLILGIVAWLFGMQGATNANIGKARKKQRSRNPTPENNKVDTPSAGMPCVASLFIAPAAGAPMERVANVEAVAGRGLVGDRYFLENGHWSGSDDSQVTLISKEDIDDMERKSEVYLQNGEHRRNIVISNLAIDTLNGKRFFIGSACFGYERPRPPCAYIQLITEPGMVKALGRNAGICVRCIKSGIIKEGDQIRILQITLWQAIRYRYNLMLREWRPNTNNQDKHM